MRHRFLATIFAMLAAGWALAAPLSARAQASEQEVKAAFLPKFARYIALPGAALPPAGQPYYLCVIGRDPFGTMLDRAASAEVVDGHAVAVRRFANTASEAVAGCHIAFVAGPTEALTRQMLEALRQRATLTVTDGRAGGARGIIHFTLVSGRVRFHINNAAAAERGITISSRLLALAVEVKQ